MRWNKITLVGVGLLGGSLGLALRRRKLAKLIAGYVRREASIKDCERAGATDFATTDLLAAVSDAEMNDAIEFVGLTKRIRDNVGTYSQGMRQRLGLAQALLPAPEVIFLDEPTNGLDPEGIAEMRLLIQRLHRERGLTVLFCSHLLSEVEVLCERVAILNQGNLLYTGRWHDLMPKGTRYRIEIDPWSPEFFGDAVLVRPGVVEIPPGGDVAELVARFVKAGVKVRVIEPERQTLEQLYLEKVLNA